MNGGAIDKSYESGEIEPVSMDLPPALYNLRFETDNLIIEDNYGTAAKGKGPDVA